MAGEGGLAAPQSITAPLHYALDPETALHTCDLYGLPHYGSCGGTERVEVAETFTHEEIVAYARTLPTDGERAGPYMIVKRFHISPNKALAAWKESRGGQG